MNNLARLAVQRDDYGFPAKAISRLAHGWSPEEIHFQHPSLSMAQIHAALSFYYDHQQALDAQIADRLREVDRLASAAGESPFRKRLHATRP
jgi:hypothetical protein